MDQEKAICHYELLDDAAKVRLLGKFCFDLTIDFRAIISEAMPNQEKLKGINELQHKALAQMMHHHAGRSKRYPDRVFLAILLDLGNYYGLNAQVQRSLFAKIESCE